MVVVTFQIVICLLVKCTGVSIIWCTTLSFIVQLLSVVSSCRLHQLLLVQLHSVDSMNYDETIDQSSIETNTHDNHTYNKKQQLPMTSSLSSLHTIKYTKLTILINMVVLLYYGIVSEVITSIAHVCAILLGLLLWKIALWI